MENVKLVVVGDGDVGKTSLLISYTTDTFPDGNTSLVFDNSPVYLDVDDMEISLGLWDTASSEGYDRLRPFSYPKTDVFLLCYSVSSQTSLQNIRSKWMPEVSRYFWSNFRSMRSLISSKTRDVAESQAQLT
jgi:Ras-related C3 botulinum toxin substrate 1